MEVAVTESQQLLLGQQLIQTARRLVTWPDGAPIAVQGCELPATGTLLGGHNVESLTLYVQCECSSCQHQPALCMASGLADGDEEQNHTSLQRLTYYCQHASAHSFEALEVELERRELAGQLQGDEAVAQEMERRLTDLVYVQIPHDVQGGTAGQQPGSSRGVEPEPGQGAGAGAGGVGYLTLKEFYRQAGAAAGGEGLVKRRVAVCVFGAQQAGAHSPQAALASQQQQQQQQQQYDDGQDSQHPHGAAVLEPWLDNSQGQAHQEEQQQPRGWFGGTVAGFDPVTGLHWVRYDPHPDLALWHPDPDGLHDAVSLAACHVWVQPLPGDPLPDGAWGAGGDGPLHPGEQEQQQQRQQRRLRGLCGPFHGCLPAIPGEGPPAADQGAEPALDLALAPQVDGPPAVHPLPAALDALPQPPSSPSPDQSQQQQQQQQLVMDGEDAQLPDEPPGPDATQAGDGEQGPAGGLVHATDEQSPAGASSPGVSSLGASPPADETGEVLSGGDGLDGGDAPGTSKGPAGLDAQPEQGALPAKQQQQQDQQHEPMELEEAGQQLLHGEGQGGVGEAARSGLGEADGVVPMDTAADAVAREVEAQEAAGGPLHGEAPEGGMRDAAAEAVTAMEVDVGAGGDAGGDMVGIGVGIGGGAGVGAEGMELGMGSQAASGAEDEGCQQTGPWEQQGQQQLVLLQEEAQSGGGVDGYAGGAGVGEGPPAAQASGSAPSVGDSPAASPVEAAAAGSVGVGGAGPGSGGAEEEEEEEEDDDDEEPKEVVFMLAGPAASQQAGGPGASGASEASLQGAPQGEQQPQGVQGVPVGGGGQQQAAESEAQGVQQPGQSPGQQGDAVSSSAVEATARASLQQQQQQQQQQGDQQIPEDGNDDTGAQVPTEQQQQVPMEHQVLEGRLGGLQVHDGADHTDTHDASDDEVVFHVHGGQADQQQQQQQQQDRVQGGQAGQPHDGPDPTDTHYMSDEEVIFHLPSGRAGQPDQLAPQPTAGQPGQQQQQQHGDQAHGDQQAVPHGRACAAGAPQSNGTAHAPVALPPPTTVTEAALRLDARLLQLGWPPERRLPLLTWVALLPPGEAAEAVLAMEGARDLGRLLERAFGWSWAA